MQSLRICISCVGFPMEILLLRWGNVSIDIRIGDNLTNVYLKECIVIWEKQAHSLLVHLLVVEDVDKDDVLDTAPSPRQISSATGRLSCATRCLQLPAQDCVHPSICVPWRGWKEHVCVTEVPVGDDLINRIQVTAADTVPGQLFFVRGSIWRHCEACVQTDGGHFEQLLWLCTVHPVKKGALRNDDWKMLQRTEFDFFRCNKGIHWLFMSKRTVFIL
jgi:hypothetical protein